jgi:branched-chain amino acid transport system substrate-binding protein
MNIFRRRLLKSLSLALVAPAPARAQPAKAPIRIALIEGLSGPFGNTGEAVYRNLLWAVERVNARGGVKLPGGHRMLGLERYDSKGQNEEGLAALRSAIDDGIQFVVQGNSSSVAAVLIDAINKHNEREPGKRVLFLNYSAVDPVLTNEKCSFWHFRFDAHADMRMAALMEVIRDDKGGEERVPDRPGLQLRAGRAARGAAGSWGSSGRTCRLSATSCIQSGGSRTSCRMRPRSRPAARRP